MSEYKLSKTQEKLKQRVEKAGEIYERLYGEYHKNSSTPWWRDALERRACVEIQTTLLVSERKAKEYLKVVKAMHKPSTGPRIP